jgi:hypothetical protein
LTGEKRLPELARLARRQRLLVGAVEAKLPSAEGRVHERAMVWPLRVAVGVRPEVATALNARRPAF